MSLRIKQWLWLAFLLVYGGYHLACAVQYREFIGDLRPSVVAGKNVFWLAHWKMFTGLQTYHSVPSFEARTYEPEVDMLSDWEEIPMEEWFPARWESGYRWERPAVYTRRSVQVRFLDLACRRAEGAYEVRLVKHRWKATLGQREQPVRKYRKDILGGFRCGTPLPEPKGIRL